MSPKKFAEMLAPRRLRDSQAESNSAEGRLARQLRSLSTHASMRQLRRYSRLSRGRRLFVSAARIAVAAILVLAVSGVAAATAGYVARQVWPSLAVVDGIESPPSGLSKVKTRGKASRQSREQSAVLPPEPKVELPAAADGRFPAAPELAAAPRRSQTVAANHTGVLAPTRQRPSEISPLIERPVRPQPLPADEVTTGSLLMTPPPLVDPSNGPPTTPYLANEPPPMKAGESTGGRGAVRTDAVTQEAALLRQALATLRREHDARGALRLLDDYDRRFGSGALAMEASSARAQVLLQLGDNSGALDLLDRLPLSQHGSTGELRVTRGELRSLSGRCRDAVLDFDAVLGAAQSSRPAEIARALFGRASCRARVGDSVGAEADRQRYLREYPQGPAARRLLSQP